MNLKLLKRKNYIYVLPLNQLNKKKDTPPPKNNNKKPPQKSTLLIRYIIVFPTHKNDKISILAPKLS